MVWLCHTHVRFCPNADHYKIAKCGINGVRDRRRTQQTRQSNDERRGWDAQRVMYVIRRDEMIRREDAIRRAELVFDARQADPQI